MRHADIVLGSQADHAVHRVRVVGVKASGDVGGTDERHDLVVHAVANEPRPETLAHVGIQVNVLLHIASACNCTPSALATFSTVAKLGLPFSLSAL